MVRRTITLEPRPKGFHLVTGEVERALPEIAAFETALLHLLIRHTSASLALTEDASPDVREDLEAWFSEAVPETRRWAHSIEGPDDMPAHVRSVLTGPDLTLPISAGKLDLGTWQVIFHCEHRDRGGARGLVATIWGGQTRGGDAPPDH